MRIINLTDPKSMIYSSNSYLILGDQNAIADVNTLIDPGNDPSIIEKLQNLPTGVGKPTIDQVVLTHSHFDHAGILSQIRAHFQPVVYAYSLFIEPDVLLEDKMALRFGDRAFQVIHTPGHTEDSVCLYNQTDGVVFVGDTPVVIQRGSATYDARFLNALETLVQKDIRAIYFGHGDPINFDARRVLDESLRNAQYNLACANRSNDWTI
jgi:glyoxylase-like metal-dependent hydrolase (beta-lactamase superfamily II)